MFSPTKQKIIDLLQVYPTGVKQIEELFFGDINVYIDHANVRPWATKLGWHIDYKRLIQFLKSFDNVRSIKIYSGTLVGDISSEEQIKKFESYGFDVGTKPVKIMRHSIDASSVPPTSPSLVEKFMRKCLLKKLSLETLEYLNNKFREMNQSGTFYVEDLKCNFDVEIGRDMLLDFERRKAETFVLWSGDSDFADPIEQLLEDKKRVILFATARKVSTELNELASRGLFIYDIQKIRNFICWRREIQKR